MFNCLVEKNCESRVILEEGSKGGGRDPVSCTYDMEGKITEYWLVETEGIFFLIFFRTRAKLLIPDWPNAKITRIWLAEWESHLHFVGVLKWETDFELSNTRITSKFDF